MSDETFREDDQLDLTELSALIQRHATGRPRVLVGIDGPGASGKSTLAELLAARLERCVVVHVDDFYLGSTLHGSRRGEIGELFDLPRLRRQVLEPAETGGSLRYQRYDWDKDELTDWISVPAGVPVLVEGVYCLEQQLRPFYSSTIYCRCDASLRLRRGLERDGEQARFSWQEVWMPAEDRYAAAQRPDEHATVLLDSSASGADGVRYRVCQWKN